MASRLTKTLRRAALGAALLTFAGPVAAQDGAAVDPMPIGFIDLVDDPRFDPEYAYHFIPVRPLGPAVNGAELGITDAVSIGGVIGVEFTLRHESGASLQELVIAVRQMANDGVNFVLADLPADLLLPLVDSVADLPITILNLTAQEDALRGESCRETVIHITPSHRMLTDALVQYLVSKRWTDILALQGPLAEDQAMLEALQESARSFGASIVDVRPILLSNDPRAREEGNMALATAGGGYEVVVVIDNDGEFARFEAPYQVNNPRPVMGTAGLVPLGWHWSWERAGAPQVNARFETTNGRRMDDGDWAGWVAVKAIVQSVLRTQSTEYEDVRGYLLGDRLNLDGSKAFPMSVRPWDHQLRQTVLLATGNAVIEMAPITGFEHRTNDLDTLGVDEPQSQCEF